MVSENILLPEKWNEWTITEKIGQGSYGTVYKARRYLGDRELFSAVKIIDIPSDEEELRAAHLEYKDEQSVKEYFQDIKDAYVKEIEVMFDLNGSPNIVTFEDFLVEEKPEIGWRIYIRMEYLEDFRIYSNSHEMTETETIKLASDICNALVYCEKKNIIHRDVKPENILRSPEGDYKLGDFGVARVARQTSASYSSKGTYAYMAPEVVKGHHYSSNVDIYSLGIVLYRLMNRNRFPFENIYKQVLSYQEKEEALNRRLNGEPFTTPPALASDGFATIIMKACCYDPSQRYQSASEMASDLKDLSSLQEETPDPQKYQTSQAEQHAEEEKETDGEVTEKEPERWPTVCKVLIPVLIIVAILAGFIGGRELFHNLSDGDKTTSTGKKAQEEVMSLISENADDVGNISDNAEAGSYTVSVIPAEEKRKEKETGNTAETEETQKETESKGRTEIQQESESEEENDSIYLVNAATLNVREEPDIDSKVIDVLKEGDKVAAEGETTDDWIQICYSSSDSDDDVTGWVSVRYLNELSTEDEESSETTEPESEITDSESGGNVSSAENSEIYEKYSSFIDPAIDDFVSDVLNTTYLSVGDESKPLAAQNGDVICYSDDESVVTVSDGGKVTAVGPGQAHVVVLSQVAIRVYEILGFSNAPSVYLYIVS